MTRHGPSDLELFDRWCAGDMRAGDALFERYYDAIYDFFKRTTYEPEEPVQQTFFVCVSKRDLFQRDLGSPDDGFRAYLYGIARKVLLEHVRRGRRQRNEIDFGDIPIASLSTTVGSRMAREVDKSRLLEALRHLTKSQQRLLLLRYWHRLNYSQLAQIFDVKEGTIRTRVFRAQQRLEELIRSSKQTDLSVSKQPNFDEWGSSLADTQPRSIG